MQGVVKSNLQRLGLSKNQVRFSLSLSLHCSGWLRDSYGVEFVRKGVEI